MTQTYKVDFSDVRWGSVEWTNLCTLYLRAYESHSPAPILGDHAAADAVDRIEYDWARMRRAMRPGSNQYMVTMRAKQLDDWSADFLRRHPDAVVLHLGCGMDTRAFRLPLPAGTIIYELDDQAVLAGKQAILDREHATPRCIRRPVAADLAQAQWPVALAAAGFNPGAPAAFVAEGLTYYLPEQADALLLDRAASIATPGSRLGVDMVSADYLTNPGVAPYLELAASRGDRWQFGSNDPGGFLAAHGWQADITTCSPWPAASADGHHQESPTT